MGNRTRKAGKTAKRKKNDKLYNVLERLSTNIECQLIKDDLEVVPSKKARLEPRIFLFNPPTRKFQNSFCKKFSLPLPSNYLFGKEKRFDANAIQALTVKAYLWALFFCLTGSESHHELIRQLVIKFIREQRKEEWCLLFMLEEGLDEHIASVGLVAAEASENEIGWMDMFFSNPPNFSQSQIRFKGDFGRAPGSAFNTTNNSNRHQNGFTQDGFTAHGGTADWYSRYRDGNPKGCPTPASPTIPMISMEPEASEQNLSTTLVLYGSDHIKVKNMEFSSATNLPTAPPSANQEAKCKIEIDHNNDQLASLMADNAKFSPRKPDANSKLPNLSYSLRQKLQYQQHQLKSSTLPTPPAQDLHHTNLESHSQLSLSQYFGVPTTPKTTPSSLHNLFLHSVVVKETGKPVDSSKTTASAAFQIRSKAEEKQEFRWPTLQQGVHQLRWCVDEQVDSVRLLTNSEIYKKSVALSDMQQPVFARYVKISYVVKQLYEFVCEIPLPAFWGTRFYSTWQAYAAANWQLVCRSRTDCRESRR
uniref:Uncharacterized protein n=1 Tax=Ditylenchus dipsaci TaxID=166011 RepID=A0A915DGJ9_9BILA